MSVTFGGLVSGLDTNALIEAEISQKSYRLNRFKTQQQTYTSEKSAIQAMSSKFSAFRSSLQKLLDGNIISSFDLFNKKDVTSSNTGAVKVTSNNLVQKGEHSIEVNKLATPPKSYLKDFAGAMNANTTMSDLGVSAGTVSFSYYSDSANPKTTQISIEVKNGDTMGSFIEKANKAMDEAKDGDGNALDIGDVEFSITSDGRLKMGLGYHVTSGDNFTSVGASNTSSNFFDVMGMSLDGARYEVIGEPKTWLNLSGKLIGNSANLKHPVTSAGKMNIGGVEIEVDDKTTMRDVINKVNNTKDGGTADISYDKVTNQLVITGRDNLYSDYIYFSGTGMLSNYGVTNSDGVWTNSGNNHTTRQNGEIVVNGQTVSVKSNTVTSNDTGIEGLTLNLLRKTKTDEPVDISITDNTEALVEAMQGVVDAYNDIVNTLAKYTKTDTESGEKGPLKNEYTLSTMQSQLRSVLMGSISSGGDDLEYKAASLIGISSGAVSGSSVSTSSTLTFDKEKFMEAYNKNPDDVRTLLLGDSSEGIEGLFQTLKTKLDDYLDYEDGYFTQKTESISKSITNLDKSISDEEDRLEKIKTRLTKQYANMETTISKLQSQGL